MKLYTDGYTHDQLHEMGVMTPEFITLIHSIIEDLRNLRSVIDYDTVPDASEVPTRDELIQAITQHKERVLLLKNGWCSTDWDLYRKAGIV